MVHEVATLADVGDLNNGRVGAAFTKALQEALQSCLNAPTVKASRKLVITVSLDPFADEGELDAVALTAKIDVKGVPRTSQPVVTRMVKDKGAVKGLRYDDLSPRDPNQQTIPMRGAAQDEGGVA